MTDQKYKLVPLRLTPEMGHTGDAILDDSGSMQAMWDGMLEVAPDLKIRAKPLEWRKDEVSGAERHWREPHMGLWISFDPEEKPSHRYTAAWGESEPEGFDTLEKAKKYCQDMADSFVRQCAHVGPYDATPENGDMT